MNIFGMKISPKYECEYYFFLKSTKQFSYFCELFCPTCTFWLCLLFCEAGRWVASSAPCHCQNCTAPCLIQHGREWHTSGHHHPQAPFIGAFPIQIICMVLFTTVHFNDNCGSSKMSLSHYEWTILILCHIWSLKYWIFLGHEGLVSRAVAIMMWSISPDKAPGIFVN